jgi:hypothetical protein
LIRSRRNLLAPLVDLLASNLQRDISHITDKSSMLRNVYKWNSLIVNYERRCYDCRLCVAPNFPSNEAHSTKGKGGPSVKLTTQLDLNERRSIVISILTSYSGGTRFESRSWHHRFFRCLIFLRHSGEMQRLYLKTNHDTFDILQTHIVIFSFNIPHDITYKVDTVSLIYKVTLVFCPSQANERNLTSSTAIWCGHRRKLLPLYAACLIGCGWHYCEVTDRTEAAFFLTYTRAGIWITRRN